AAVEGRAARTGEDIARRGAAPLSGSRARKAGPPLRPRPRREPVPGRVGFGGVVLELGSMGMAIGATAAVLRPGHADGQVSGGAGVLIALIWILMAAINFACARQH